MTTEVPNDGPKITPADVYSQIKHTFYIDAGDAIPAVLVPSVEAQQGLDQITICVLILQNGHRIVGVNAGPVSSLNFRRDIGRELALKNAMDQIWPLMGYALREKLHTGAK